MGQTTKYLVHTIEQQQAKILELSTSLSEAKREQWETGFNAACNEFQFQRSDSGHPITRNNPWGRRSNA